MCVGVGDAKSPRHYVNAWHKGSAPKFPEAHERLGGNTREYRKYVTKKYFEEHPELMRARVDRNRIRRHINTTYRNQVREANLRHRIKIKTLVFSHYSGGEPKCSCCSMMGLDFLTIDHMANNGAEHKRKTFGWAGAGGYPMYHWLYKQGYPSDFQVLCWNCNSAKQLNGGICPHQQKRLENVIER